MDSLKSEVLILGATSDIGMSLGKAYAEKGFNLILASRNVNRLDNYKLDLENRFDTKVSLINFNATDFESHFSFAELISDKCKIIIAVFGYLGDQDQAINEWEHCKTIIDSNYTGAVSILNILSEKMKKQGEGTIVGISSVAGDRGRMSNFIYGSSKAAFTSYLSGLRNSMFHSNVHVLTVKPGFVATKMTSHLDLPGKLTSSPDQVAKAIAKGIVSKKNVIYVKPIWRFIMLAIILIPNSIFKKMKM